MSIESLKNSLPEYAKDLRLNLGTLAEEETLTSQQRWGCFLSSALASRNTEVIRACMSEARTRLSSEAITAACSAAGIMAMNNIYYRFVHLCSNETYRTLPAKLRMNVIANPPVDKSDFELWSLAVSAINGCGLCIDNHEQHLSKAGLSVEAIQSAIRIAATIHAVACVLEAQTASQENQETVIAA